VQSIRHYADAASDRLGLILPFNAVHLLWGVGLVTILLSAAVYAWWRHNPVASLEVTNDPSSPSTMSHVEQPAPTQIDTNLHATTGTPEVSPSPAPDSTSRSQGVSNAQANAQLHVNGEAIPLPPKGTVHKEISSGNGKTSVDISVDSSPSDTPHSYSHTSMNIDVNSQTKSESSNEE
jgi:hypothetical protein